MKMNTPDFTQLQVSKKEKYRSQQQHSDEYWRELRRVLGAWAYFLEVCVLVNVLLLFEGFEDNQILVSHKKTTVCTSQ
jgi:hypothetical protein